MKLLTKALEKALPRLYATEKTPAKDKIALVKFFTSWADWTWYGVEYDPWNREFFGLKIGPDRGLTYWSMAELEKIQGPHGLKIERDLHFRPTKLGELEHGHSLEVLHASDC